MPLCTTTLSSERALGFYQRLEMRAHGEAATKTLACGSTARVISNRAAEAAAAEVAYRLIRQAQLFIRLAQRTRAVLD